ncbi:MAG: hypothetical protein BGO69_14710 [Bacteroidetes bacterium 46-16]|nr:MAG: hypothetical protein BGO69_14710 [Bacteroidetes bacterium 46-16]
MSENVYIRIYEDATLNEVIEDLAKNLFLAHHVNQEVKSDIQYGVLKKCIWLASILASSTDEDHCRKVQLFAMLSYLTYRDNIEVEKASLLLLSRIGNLTAVSEHFPFFKRLTDSHEDHFDALLSLELALQLQSKTILTSEHNYLVATRFQKDLWEKLNEKRHVSVSAPTSAGKSLILKRYINRLQANAKKNNFLYIVPSRALINQVSEDFRRSLDGDIEIRTSFIEPPNVEVDHNHLYILTPERCLRLIEFAYENAIDVSLIFTDEIQNIEDEKGRGTTLEYVLTELAILFPGAQVIAAGPSITNNTELFSNIFNKDSLSAKTELSPVFQIKTIIKPNGPQKLQVILKTRPKVSRQFEMDVDYDLKKLITIGIGPALSSVINTFAPNQSSIIFCPKSDWAESWALKNTPQENTLEIDNQTAELIEFLQDEVHPEYFLIQCLRHKIAFHHSRLPDLVRKEIEDGFTEGRLTKLFCTSTLIEGVNLPANNLFVISPKVLNEPLSPFRFGNLIGRAGRLKDSLYGTIYCIERDSEDKWAEEFYDNALGKDVISASNKSIQEYTKFETEVGKAIRDIKEQKHKNTTILIRQKFLKSSTTLQTYLESKKIPQESVARILKNVRESLKDLRIPFELARKNPSIDPLLQDKLYKAILESGIDNWCIHKNEVFDARIKGVDLTGSYSEWPFFWQLADLLERLDKIFSIWYEIKVIAKVDGLSIRNMCAYAVRWTTGQSYRELIKEDIKYMAKHSNEKKRINPNDKNAINKRINTVIKINTQVVSHILVKYIKLLNDIVSSQMNEEQLERFKFMLALPTMLELGTRSHAVLSLISRGVSRSVAMKVFDIFKQVEGYEDIDIIQWLGNQKTLKIKSIYLRYLRNLKLIPTN